jgi:hypothetical protein
LHERAYEAFIPGLCIVHAGLGSLTIEDDMMLLTFTILGSVACVFLMYVFVQFRRALLHARSSSAIRVSLNRRDSSGVILACSSRLFSSELQVKNEAAGRKEILDNAAFAAIGLLAPFVFIMLLSLH